MFFMANGTTAFWPVIFTGDTVTDSCACAVNTPIRRINIVFILNPGVETANHAKYANGKVF